MVAASQVTPSKRPRSGTSLLVVSILLRSVTVYATDLYVSGNLVRRSGLGLGWYWGSLFIPYRIGTISFTTIIDYISRFTQYNQATQIQYAINIVTFLASIILLYALARRSRRLLRYFALILLLPLMGNFILALNLPTIRNVNPSTILALWYYYSSDVLYIRFGDFLIAVSGIKLFRASKKIALPPVPPPGPSIQFIYCPNCGRMISSTFSNCPHCNATLPKL